MKGLRNPWVSGGLAVLAVALALYQFLPSRRSAPRAAQTQPPVPAARLLKTKPPQAAPPAATNAATLPDRGIDRAYAESHLAEWADAPRHDPFWLIPLVVAKPVPVNQYMSPVPHWKLKGIWRQTGGRVAAINNGVYSEGDSVEGYKIERIDGDQVWFRGPERMERLGFAPGDHGKGSHPPKTGPGKPPGGSPADNASTSR
jgi:hypothetical protein